MLACQAGIKVTKDLISDIEQSQQQLLLNIDLSRRQAVESEKLIDQCRCNLPPAQPSSLDDDDRDPVTS